ncbi:jg5703 [Pararge aegeria aegeria]|uniref:Jg5703 protein n=1 Tax=Pararge aegeria aegeria TaxID=348720 RepID=A0A8S4SLN0_9NEOP|nr:jg5703 [Pararge aegeria aegeria]
MLAEDRAWKAVVSFCETVLVKKEAAERDRERANPARRSQRRRAGADHAHSPAQYTQQNGKTKDGPVQITVKIFHPNTARAEMQTSGGPRTDMHCCLLLAAARSGAANCTHIKLNSPQPFNICHKLPESGLAI